MDFKKSNANKTTVTQDLGDLELPTGNIYEAVVIMSKRADQINEEVREGLHGKLEEFATSTETLEEIFDNKEQIEVSKFYENLPQKSGKKVKFTLDILKFLHKKLRLNKIISHASRQENTARHFCKHSRL